MVSDREAIISGRDKGWGDAGDVQRKVLQTAAQMALARGFQYFVIVGTEDRTKSGYVAIPGTASANTTGYAYCTGYFCSEAANTVATGSPGYLAPYTQAGADVTVHFYREGEIDSATPGLFTAAAILQK